MEIKIPELSLVVLIGVSGSGKSSFARKHFKDTEILSSDTCRGWVSDDENNQAASKDAFELLHYIASKRLKNGLLTLVDATNVQKEARKELIDLARAYHVLPVAIVLDLPEVVCIERNQNRPDRDFGDHVIYNQRRQLKRSIRSLGQEGFRHIHVLQSVAEVEAVSNIRREKLYNNKKDEYGPFDIIGDVHGCFDELCSLMEKLGYGINKVAETAENFGFEVSPPNGRKLIFLGDLVDRGPNSPDVLRLVMSMVKAGTAYCVPGNHDSKLKNYLDGKKVQLKHGLEKTVDQLSNTPEAFKSAVQQFIDGLVSHYVLDHGKLVVAHAGLREDMQGRGSGAVRNFCMYGETTGEIDEFGLPVRYNWALEYRGQAKVVYGHTPIPHAEWLNRTIDIDTGCVFGGKLTALRYPELQLLSVQAKEVYCEPVRPIGYGLQAETMSAQLENDDVLDIEDVIGKRIIQTHLRSNITIREENSIAALEVMSRFAVNPRWLIYLPPTMSPCASSEEPGFLEHPAQALNYYKKRGVRQVVCEEKHMGSRAVLVICRDEKVSLDRFGVKNEGLGVCYTRTGRNFFNDPVLEKTFLDRVCAALGNTGFWEKFETDWVCLDAELMPWSAKAQALLSNQYAAVGAAASASLSMVEQVLNQTLARGIEGTEAMLQQFSGQRSAVQQYIQAYRQYCWPVNSVDDYKLAPFHILATENAVHVDQNHQWHLENIVEFCAGDPVLLMPTLHRIVDLHDEANLQAAIDWWMDLTKKGGEGMVVKPFDFLTYDVDEGLLQPAVKCRGSEYLRIIYGPTYDTPENLVRLRKRSLTGKQSLAMREFALGIEALERFVRKEPLRRTHESVFGVLALESEAVDPRL
jgi:protein phosphatase